MTGNCREPPFIKVFGDIRHWPGIASIVTFMKHKNYEKDTFSY
jgi:hypothetical protein